MPVYAECVCVHSVHVYGQSDRCWAPIVIDFNAYQAALPTGRCHRLLAGRNCKVREAWNGWKYNKGTES